MFFKSIRMRVIALAALTVGSYSNVAVADTCKDILLNPVLDRTEIKYDNYESVAIFSRLKQIYERKKNQNVEATIPFEGIPVPLSFERAEALKSVLEREYSFQSVSANSGDILLLRGQKEIVEAWRDCMSDRGGFGVRFEEVAGTEGKEVWLHIEYLGIRLGTDIRPPLRFTWVNISQQKNPNVTIQDDPRNPCLKAGYVIHPRSTCRVKFVFKDAWTDLNVTINVTAGRRVVNSFSATLPPRAKIKFRSELLHFSEEHYRSQKNSTPSPLYCIPKLPSSLIVVKGPENRDIKFSLRGKAERRYCSVEFVRPNSQGQMCAQIYLAIHINGDHWCRVSFDAQAVQPYWDPPKPAKTQAVVRHRRS